MTTLAHRSSAARAANGGVAARRAMIRWAWRMFRREWRQQILVIALLTVAVAAAIGSVTIAYNSGPADDAEFGSANHLLRFDGTDPRTLEAGLDAARNSSGRPTSSATARWPSPAASTRWSSAPRTRTAPTAARCSHSAEAATRRAPARSPSPTVWRRSSGSRSGRRWPSTAVAGPSSASSRTHVI